MIRPTPGLAALLLVATGCHARFQRAVPTLDVVRAQLVTGTANREVDVDRVQRSLASGLTETLDQGPPFRVSDDPGVGPVLQLELRDVAVDGSSARRPGELALEVRVELFTASGERVYRTVHRCAADVVPPRSEHPGLYVSNHVKRGAGVDARELDEASERIARACGAELAAQLRRHAQASELDRIGQTLGGLAEPNWGPEASEERRSSRSPE